MPEGVADLSSLDFATELMEQRVLCLNITCGLVSERLMILFSCDSSFNTFQSISILVFVTVSRRSAGCKLQPNKITQLTITKNFIICLRSLHNLWLTGNP